jgi:hypothetical protein
MSHSTHTTNSDNERYGIRPTFYTENVLSWLQGSRQQPSKRLSDDASPCTVHQYPRKQRPFMSSLDNSLVRAMNGSFSLP